MHLRNKVIILVVVLSVLTFAKAVNAATYYVSTSGSDSNPGTSASPFRTITKAFSFGGPGVTVRIKPGTYKESFNGNIPSGTDLDANAFTITADDPNNMPIINGGGEDVIHLYQNNHHIIFDRLIIDGTNTNPKRQAIKVDGNSSGGAHHIRFQYCEIRNAGGQGILLAPGADHNEILYCNVHHNGNNRGIHGIYWAGGTGKIVGNDVHHNSHYGGQLAYNGTYDLLVERNKWHDNGGGGLNNYSSPRNMLIINNIVYGNGTMDGTPGMDLYGSPNLKVYNNTVYGNRGSGISYDSTIQYDPTNPNRLAGSLDLRNNISYGNRTDFSIVDGRNLSQANNLFGTDPKFVNAAGLDFRLTAGSPAINAGATISIVTKDFTGAARPVGSAYDIGAYEYGGVMSPTPTPTPTPGTLNKGDLNNDKIANSLDWSIMNNKWLTSDTAADLNSDGIVNTIDFSIMNGNWLKSG